MMEPFELDVDPTGEDPFFHHSLDLLCQLGFDLRFTRLNPAWERTLGWTRAELMAVPFWEFVHPDDRERTLDQNRRVRAGDLAVGFENRYRCKDGSYRWLHWSAASVLHHGQIYGVARDITSQKEAEAERERLVAELQAALAEVKALRAILPVCSYCRKIRDEQEQWLSLDAYLLEHTNSQVSHGICPECEARAAHD